MIRRLIAPLTVVIFTLHAGQAFAQGAFPAPLPGQAGAASGRDAVHEFADGGASNASGPLR